MLFLTLQNYINLYYNFIYVLCILIDSWYCSIVRIILTSHATKYHVRHHMIYKHHWSIVTLNLSCVCSLIQRATQMQSPWQVQHGYTNLDGSNSIRTLDTGSVGSLLRWRISDTRSHTHKHTHAIVTLQQHYDSLSVSNTQDKQHKLSSQHQLMVIKQK